jgi:acetyl-CoA C-acetyltransferase/acetyl-CoA acyltransferase
MLFFPHTKRWRNWRVYVITAGNASQLSDGASACVLMESKMAEQQGLTPLGIYRGMAVAGNAPEEMLVGPIFAIPKLLKNACLRIEDIGLWELNEAFACQVLYCRDHLGIDPEIYKVLSDKVYHVSKCHDHINL